MSANMGHDLGAVIGELLDTYRPLGVGIWLCSQNRNLDGRRPLDLLREGDPGPVIDEAQRLAGGPLADQRAAADDGLRARLRELADDLDYYTTQRGRPAGGSYDDGVNKAQADAARLIRAALDPPTAAPCSARHDVTDDGVTAGWFCTLTEAHDEHQDSQSRRWTA